MTYYRLADSPLVELMKRGVKHELQKGQVLTISKRSIFYFIETGYVKRYQISDSGDESIQAIYGPGYLFPLTPVFKSAFSLEIYKGTEEFFYETVVPVTAYSISEAELSQALDKDVALYKDLFYVSGMRLGSNINKLENASLHGAPEKVAHLLRYFALMYGAGSDTNAQHEIEVPLTHQTIAECLNMARETVSHCMTLLGNYGLVSNRGKHIVVKDIGELETFAFSGPNHLLDN